MLTPILLFCYLIFLHAFVTGKTKGINASLVHHFDYFFGLFVSPDVVIDMFLSFVKSHVPCELPKKKKKVVQ